MPEIIKNNEDLLFINDELVDKIKMESQKSDRNIARLLMHKSHDDLVQEMLIAMCKDSCIIPNRCEGKSESLQIIEGRLLIVIFDECGVPIKKVEMSQFGSGKVSLYRMSSTPWHTMIPLSNSVVVHEVIEGPFSNVSDPIPDWIPNDHGKLASFIRDLKINAIEP